MFERPAAGEPGRDSPVVRIDSSVFETLSAPAGDDEPRVARWLGAWASDSA